MRESDEMKCLKVNDVAMKWVAMVGKCWKEELKLTHLHFVLYANEVNFDFRIPPPCNTHFRFADAEQMRRGCQTSAPTAARLPDLANAADLGREC